MTPQARCDFLDRIGSVRTNAHPMRHNTPHQVIGAVSAEAPPEADPTRRGHRHREPPEIGRAAVDRTFIEKAVLSHQEMPQEGTGIDILPPERQRVKAKCTNLHPPFPHPAPPGPVHALRAADTPIHGPTAGQACSSRGCTM